MKVRPAILLRRTNRVLLLHYRYGDADVYGLPGGNPNPEETLAEALTRELLEELNLTIRVGPLILMGEVILPEKAESVLHCVFEGEIVSGEPEINPTGTSALGFIWKPVHELAHLNLYPNVGAALANFLGGRLSGPYIGQIAQEWFE
ncbi:MAG: NUDIX hydrolase [Cytophagaceae bacterium]|nr:NUDIX hydrolase [Cytophagaceae bacterium]